MGVLLIRSEPSWRSQLRHKTQAAELRSLEALSAALGHTGVEACHLISCHKARQPINQDKAAELLLEKSHSGESTHTHTHTHTHVFGWSMCLCINSKAWRCSPPASQWQTLWGSCMHMYSRRYTHTHTHTHTLWQVLHCYGMSNSGSLFSSDLSPCVMTQRRGDERRGRDRGGGEGGVEWSGVVDSDRRGRRGRR